MSKVPNNGRVRKRVFEYLAPKKGDRTRARAVLPFLDGIPLCALRVGMRLIDRCANGLLYPAEHRMMHDCRLSRRSDWRGIKWLVKAKLLHRYQDALGHKHPSTKSDWRRNSYELNWPGFNRHYAEHQAHCRKFRRAENSAENADTSQASQENTCQSGHVMPENTCQSGHVMPENTCQSGHVNTCQSWHANHERGTMKGMNRESAFGAAAHGLDNATMQPSELTQWLTGGLPPSPRPSKVHQNTLRHRPVGKHCA
jgi:hypothetical protein